MNSITYTEDWRQIITRRLYTSDVVLNTAEMNQSVFMEDINGDPASSAVICNVDTVALDRNTATVVKCSHCRSWDVRIVVISD